MESTLKKNLLWGTVFTSVLGVLFHFGYDFTQKSPVFAWFFPINESTWEHLKLLFYPALLWTIGSYFFFRTSFGKKEADSYLNAGAKGVFWGMLSIVVLFYTYTGILGRSVDFINILLFFVGVILCYAILYKTFLRSVKKDTAAESPAGVLFFLLFLILFILFTYIPPNLGLFISPAMLQSCTNGEQNQIT